MERESERTLVEAWQADEIKALWKERERLLDELARVLALEDRHGD